MSFPYRKIEKFGLIDATQPFNSEVAQSLFDEIKAETEAGMSIVLDLSKVELEEVVLKELSEKLKELSGEKNTALCVTAQEGADDACANLESALARSNPPDVAKLKSHFSLESKKVTLDEESKELTQKILGSLKENLDHTVTKENPSDSELFSEIQMIKSQQAELAIALDYFQHGVDVLHEHQRRLNNLSTSQESQEDLKKAMTEALEHIERQNA